MPSLFIKLIYKNTKKRKIYSFYMGIGDWGLGPIPNPQTPIPKPHPHFIFLNFLLLPNSLIKLNNIIIF